MLEQPYLIQEQEQLIRNVKLTRKKKNQRDRLLQKQVKKWLEKSKKAKNATNWMPPNTPGAFVHVGKTGGSGLSRLLRFGCHSFVPKPCYPEFRDQIRFWDHETVLSKVTTYYHIPDFEYLGIGKMTKPSTSKTGETEITIKEDPYLFYVMTVRDPYSRILSVFTYSHPVNRRARGDVEDRPLTYTQKFRTCFPSLENFTEHLGDQPEDYNGSLLRASIKLTNYKLINCSIFARAIMNRKIPESDHFYYTIKSVYDRVKQHSSSLFSSKLLVTRTENLWEDWIAVNKYLGQEEVVITNNTERKVRDQSRFPNPVSKEISPTGQERLCRALKEEYESYLEILERAENLDDTQRAETLAIGREHCPGLDVWNKTKMIVW